LRGSGRYDYQLPDGWRWTTLGEIADVKGGVTLNKTQTSEDQISVPYLRVANVQRGYTAAHHFL
jgi:type I restriction enzyme S subunit